MASPTGTAVRAKGRFPRRLIFLLTNVIAVASLVWVLHDANLGELRHEIRRLDWRWVAFSAVTGVLSFAWQAWRWGFILKPIRTVSVGQTLRAIFVGLYANEVLPLRAGEIIRCFLQARWNNIPISVSFASALIERIFDGVWLVAGLFVTLRLAPNLPKPLVNGGYVLGAAVLACAGLLAVAMYWKEQTLNALVNRRWLGWAHILIKDLHLIGHSRYLYYSALLSVPYLLMQALPVYGMFRAYGQLSHLSLANAFATMIILRVGGVIPQAPGNLGAFNFLTVVSLTLFGVARPLAKRFSFLLWGAVTLPLLAVGFVALAITGLKMSELHLEATAGRNSRASETAGETTGRRGI